MVTKTTTTATLPPSPLAWQETVAAKRDSCLAKIPSEWRLSEAQVAEYRSGSKSMFAAPAQCGILTPAEVTITEDHDATSLVALLAAGRISSVAVTNAFCKRAAIAQGLTNCLTEIFFDVALERARELDAHLAATKKPVGPLHGLPISVKDSFSIKGIESTIGYVSFINNPLTKSSAADQGPGEAENSALVDVLLKLGAVLYVKTNIPQTLMTGDSHNNVFGRVLNPHNVLLGAGGSSGGEGALVALRGSILGVGTDIGGSVRIPALSCGVWGFKPSASRVPYGGQRASGRPGAPGILACAGPLATSCRDLGLFSRSVLGSEAKAWEHDSLALAVPWRSDMETKVTKDGLRIGLVVPDENYPLHPPVKRALATAVSTLKAAGFNLIDLQDKGCPTATEALVIAASMFSLDNSKTWLRNIEQSGEPLVPSVQKMQSHINKKADEGYSMEELFDLIVARHKYQERWNRVLVENQIDVLLGPSSQGVAMPHDCFGSAPYQTVWNCLDYPALVIPYLKADQEIDAQKLAVPDDEHVYDAAVSHGAPISIQICARRMQDEALLSAAELIDAHLKMQH